LLRELSVDGDPAAAGRLDLLLELGDSSITYRTRYLSTVQVHAVVDLLLTDETNPRSIAFQVATLARHLDALPRDPERATLAREHYLITAMESQLRLADVQKLCEARNLGRQRAELSNFLLNLERQAFELSEVLVRKYFSHALPMRSTAARGMVP